MKHKKNPFLSVVFLAAFALWTAAVKTMDVRPIGPDGSPVGFAGINRFVHDLTGVHLGLYVLTDWLSLMPLLFILGFGLLGLSQWIQRKSIRKVDRSILALGTFYLTTGAVYLFFEKCIINYRPVLIDGALEASYPSSTTVLVLCVMATGAMELKERIPYPGLRKWVVCLISIFAAFMVVGRLLSGVHWVTDIIGGILLSAGLILFYNALKKTKRDC